MDTLLFFLAIVSRVGKWLLLLQTETELAPSTDTGGVVTPRRRKRKSDYTPNTSGFLIAIVWLYLGKGLCGW